MFFLKLRFIESPISLKLSLAMALNLLSVSVSAANKIPQSPSAPSTPSESSEKVESGAPTPTNETLPPKVEFNAGDIWNIDIFQRDDHKVLVIQDRKYTKAQKIELGVHLGLTKANPFYNTFSYGVHADYHFSEYLGLEAFFNSSSSKLTADAKQINDFLAKANFSSIKEYQKPILFSGLGALWSPIYGKFAFFRRSIIHFDIFGTAGMSVMKSQTNHPLGRDQTHPGTLASLGARIFLAKNWALRLETRHNAFRSFFAPAGPASDPGEGITLWRQAWQFSAGTSFSFGGPEKDILSK